MEKLVIIPERTILRSPADSSASEGGRPLEREVIDIVARIKQAAEVHESEACEKRKAIMATIVERLLSEGRKDLIEGLQNNTDAAYWLRDIVQSIVDGGETYKHLTGERIAAHLMAHVLINMEDFHTVIFDMYMNPEDIS